MIAATPTPVCANDAASFACTVYVTVFSPSADTTVSVVVAPSTCLVTLIPVCLSHRGVTT